MSQWCIYNGKVLNTCFLNLPAKYDLCIYEVIRIINGIPLFIEDHLQRLFYSLRSKNKKVSFNQDDCLQDIKLLLKYNNLINANIRYEIIFYEEKVHRFVHPIQHFYPPANWYRKGVEVMGFRATRNEPNVKIFYNDFKSQIDNKLKENNAYEAILIDNKGFITEGSKSNVFFICDECIYTAPDEKVLNGITRKYVIDIIKQLNLPLKFESLAYNDLNYCQSMFLTGTSPKVLPVKKFDAFIFDPQIMMVQKLIHAYDDLINDYLKKFKF